MELKTKQIKTYKYGTTTLVQACDGYVKIGSKYLGFANGLCVYIGSKESEAQAAVGTEDPLWSA